MGLLTQLLTLPVAPVRGAVWIAQRVVEAEEEYYDPAPVWRELRELESRLVRGEIDQEAFDRRGDELLDRLDEIDAHRRGCRDPEARPPCLTPCPTGSDPPLPGGTGAVRTEFLRQPRGHPGAGARQGHRHRRGHPHQPARHRTADDQTADPGRLRRQGEGDGHRLVGARPSLSSKHTGGPWRRRIAGSARNWTHCGARGSKRGAPGTGGLRGRGRGGRGGRGGLRGRGTGRRRSGPRRRTRGGTPRKRGR